MGNNIDVTTIAVWIRYETDWRTRTGEENSGSLHWSPYLLLMPCYLNMFIEIIRSWPILRKLLIYWNNMILVYYVFCVHQHRFAQINGDFCFCRATWLICFHFCIGLPVLITSWLESNLNMKLSHEMLVDSLDSCWFAK